MLHEGLLEAARKYRTQVINSYQLITPEQIEHIPDQGEFIVTRKYDGHLYFLGCVNGSDWVLFNTNGDYYTDTVITRAMAQAARDAFPRDSVPNLLFAGELFYPERRETARKVSVHLSGIKEPESKLQFLVHGVITMGEQNYTRCSIKERLEATQLVVSMLTEYHSCLPALQFGSASSAQGASELTDILMAGGCEGVVIHTQDRIYKVKPKHTVDLAVIGFTRTERLLKTLLLGAYDQDGFVHVIGTVSNGVAELPAADRRRILASSEHVDSHYAAVDRKHRPFQMIRPEWVVEVEMHDVITADGRDQPVYTDVLAGPHATLDRYEIIKKVTSLKMINATIKGMRNDKKADAHDCRISQFNHLIDCGDINTRKHAGSYRDPEFVQHEVYEKGDNVKKLTIVRTGIEIVTHDDWPYVFIFVDYAPNRKTEPFRRAVRPAPTMENAQEWLEKFKKAEIKRGWELVK